MLLDLGNKKIPKNNNNNKITTLILIKLIKEIKRICIGLLIRI